MYNWKNNSFNGKLLHFVKCFIVAAFIQCLSPWLITFPFIFILVYLILTYAKLPMLRKPKFKITYLGKDRWGENKWKKDYFTMKNWSDLKLNRLQSAWLYFVCLMKSDNVSIKATIDDKIFYIWGEEVKTRTRVYSREWGAIKPDREYYTMGKIKEEGLFPHNCQLMNFAGMSEQRLLTFINITYRNVESIDDVYKLKKKSIILNPTI